MPSPWITDVEELMTDEDMARLDAEYLSRISREIGMIFSIDKASVREALIDLMTEKRRESVRAALEARRG